VPDAANDDLVIAAGEGVFHRALQDRQHVLQARAASRAAAVADPVPGGRETAAGEVRGQVLLGCGEHVHHERPVTPDRPQRQAVQIETDQHERRVK
jgi:hypothetical protein